MPSTGNVTTMSGVFRSPGYLTMSTEIIFCKSLLILSNGEIHFNLKEWIPHLVTVSTLFNNIISIFLHFFFYFITLQTNFIKPYFIREKINKPKVFTCIFWSS